ncbi:MAG: DUF1080 domain-containing protein [Chitinophagaceae bacterium]|nr:DUF1080 domain-containing protein [Chitinophagaceae bacterium]
MKNVKFVLLLALSFVTSQFTFANGKIEGRWDISIYASDRVRPSWLEISHSGIKTLVGHFVHDGGSARPISEIFVEGNKFHFSIPPQWENINKPLVMEGVFEGDSLKGTILYPIGEKWEFVAKRAPDLIPAKEPVWGAPIKLFNGKDLTGWEPMGKNNQWMVEKGVLKSPKSGVNIRSSKTFTDFKLHIEFRYPEESNSGVYLRGRYEVQVNDAKGHEPNVGELGAIYGFIKPLYQVAKAPGEWQSYDITIVGRIVTVIANGKTVIYKQEIPGITGGAIDSNEGLPGPIMMQGDHGPIEYRNIVITPAK